MGNYVFAAIDIGSNAARLLIKSIEEDSNGEAKFTKLMFLRFPLRLGDDVFTHGKISMLKEEKMLRMIKGFKQLMRIHDVDAFRACATSAMRDAKNGKEIIKMIRKETGVDIEIIDGKQEAAILYESHIEQMAEDKGNYIFVDVGGGSTEVTLICEGKMISSESYNVGTIRLLHNKVEPDVMQKLKADLTQLKEAYPDTNIIGSGGNINKLYRLASAKKKNDLKLTVTALTNLYESMKNLNVEERIERFLLKRDRADVIVPAAEVFLFIADCIGAQYIYVPTLGLADGIIDKIYEKKKQQKPRDKSSLNEF